MPLKSPAGLRQEFEQTIASGLAFFWQNPKKLDNRKHNPGQNVQNSQTTIQSNHRPTSRLDSLDVLRGIALAAMATYHFSWDLELFGFLAPGTAGSGFLKFYARSIASSFLFIMGFSLVLATLNGIKWRRFLIRLAQVSAAALTISIATYFAMPETWIFFGILHHIAVASLIGLIFIHFHWAIVLCSALAVFLLPGLGIIWFQASWLNFFGLMETLPVSNDFVPLFPWLSASLAGIASAKLAQKFGFLKILAPIKANTMPARQLKFLGQHSLIFYLLHQPILIALVWLFVQIAPPSRNFVARSFQNECQIQCQVNFSTKQCEVYCNCFESELKDNAAQWSQLAADAQSKAISTVCSQVMQETPTR